MRRSLFISGSPWVNYPEILRYPVRMCENFLNQGCEEGYLKCDELGRYYLDVNWYRPIVNYLGAQHAIEEI